MQCVIRAACLVVTCLVSFSGHGQITTQLVPTEFESLDNPLGKLVVDRWRCGVIGKEPDMRGMPARRSSDSAFFRIVPGYGNGVEVRALVAFSDPAALYVDTNADLGLADETPVHVVSTENAWMYFGIADVAGNAQTRGDIRFRVWARRTGSDSLLRLAPAGACVGSLTFEDGQRGVALVDRDYNGRFDDAPTSWHEKQASNTLCDYLVVSHLGDPSFEHGADETAPIGSLVRISGSYYRVSAEPDGSSVTLEPTTPATGRLDAGDVSVHLWVASRENFFLLSDADRLPDGTWELPVGDYWINRIAYQRRDHDGTRWLLWHVPVQMLDEVKPFKIIEGKLLKLPLGGPISIRTNAVLKARTITVTAELLGQGGELYSVSAPDTAGWKPTAAVVDEKGRQLALLEGALKGRGVREYSWQAPPHFKGRIRFDIGDGLGPFDYVTEETWYTVAGKPQSNSTRWVPLLPVGVCATALGVLAIVHRNRHAQRSGDGC